MIRARFVDSLKALETLSNLTSTNAAPSDLHSFSRLVRNSRSEFGLENADEEYVKVRWTVSKTMKLDCAEAVRQE